MRRYLDIIREFSDPNEEDDDGNQTILVYNIVWDVSPEEEAKLPKRVSTTLHDVQEAADPYADEENRDDLMLQIGQWLEANYGGGLSNFEYRFL
jgi:hypothetical protein